MYIVTGHMNFATKLFAIFAKEFCMIFREYFAAQEN